MPVTQTAASDPASAGSRLAAHRFGGWVFTLCDALLFTGLLFLVGTYGAQATGVRPPEATLPWLATGCVALAALLHRARSSPSAAALGCAAALVLVVFFWRECDALGYSMRVSRHAMGMHLLTRVWAIHVAGACVGLVLGILRSETTARQPVLRVVLPFFALVGAAVCLTLF